MIALVADKVVLMVVFGVPEVLNGLDDRRNGFSEPLVFQFLLDSQRTCLLVFIVCEKT